MDFEKLWNETEKEVKEITEKKSNFKALLLDSRGRERVAKIYFKRNEEEEITKILQNAGIEVESRTAGGCL